jgi:hypothetical protein
VAELGFEDEVRVSGDLGGVGGAVAAAVVAHGGVIRISSPDQLAGTITSTTRPGWGKTVALGVVGVVPAVLYRTMGKSEAEHGFLFRFSEGPQGVLVQASAAGAGAGLASTVLTQLRGGHVVLEAADAAELWRLAWDRVDGFVRTRRELESLLETGGLDPATMTSAQLHALLGSGWASEPDDPAPWVAAALEAVAAAAPLPELPSEQPLTPARPPQGDGGDIAARLRRLHELRDAELITATDFEDRYQRILEEL